MPVFSTPMMFASVPVVPTAGTRSAERDARSVLDCHERLDRLEENVKSLANAMKDLQTIVHDQTRALEEINARLKSKADQPGGSP
jgi:t-SNARE complex subunit (syntaxin)